MTATETKPVDIDAPPCWPPVAHIFRKKDGPVREGMLALCGERMMGIDIDLASAQNICQKCLEIAKREVTQC